MYKAYNIPGNQTQIVKTMSTIHSVPQPREEKTATGGKNKASSKFQYQNVDKHENEWILLVKSAAGK